MMIALSEALAWIERSVTLLDAERIPIEAARGRVLTTGLAGGGPCPARAAIDGFAVRAAETEGASDYAPLPVSAMAIVVGAALPEGADAVLPPHLAEGGCALAAVAPGDGVSPPDPLALAPGTVLRPPHLALLARRGLAEVEVVRRPTIALHVAGPKSGPDVLTPMLRALIEAEGGSVDGSVPDLAIHAGRSGPGPDDDGVRAFARLFAHGVAMRPGETCALGWVSETPALLLPGNPLPCATAFALLAAPALHRLGGRPEPAPVTATLTRKIASGLGQVDAVRVRLSGEEAMPLDGAVLSAGAEADGIVLVPEGSEGYPAGARVAIYRLP